MPRLVARRRKKMVPLHANYLGDTATPAPPTTSQQLQDMVSSDGFKTVSGAALLYHGYRRTGSIVWGLLYGAAGKYFPMVAVPVAVAQGFGKRRVCTTE